MIMEYENLYIPILFNILFNARSIKFKYPIISFCNIFKHYYQINELRQRRTKDRLFARMFLKSLFSSSHLCENQGRQGWTEFKALKNGSRQENVASFFFLASSLLRTTMSDDKVEWIVQPHMVVLFSSLFRFFNLLRNVF